MGFDAEPVDRCAQRAGGEPLAGQRQQLRGIAAGPGKADRQACGGAAVMLETQGIALHGAIERAQIALQSCEQALQWKQERRGVGDRSCEFTAAGEALGRPYHAEWFVRFAAQALQVQAGARAEALRDRGGGQRQ